MSASSRALLRYAVSSFLVVLVVAGGAAALLDEPGRRGVLLAAAIAWPVQVAAFTPMARNRGEVTSFFLWWGIGIAVRALVVVAVGVASANVISVGRAPLLLSLIGFLFGMILMEPLFLKADAKKDVKARP